jgi:SAM-dependent methyltransferase
MSAPAEPGGAYDPATLAFYDAEAPEYVASGKDGVSRWLPQFIDMLPVGARVLELGCGGGRDAEAMLLRGLDVEPTDGSAAIAAKAQQRLGCPVRVMRFDELSSVEAYDAVWASASLLHVPLRKLPRILQRVFRSLRPGGLHFASYKAAERRAATMPAATSITPTATRWSRHISAARVGNCCLPSNMCAAAMKAGRGHGSRLPLGGRSARMRQPRGLDRPHLEPSGACGSMIPSPFSPPPAP